MTGLVLAQCITACGHQGQALAQCILKMLGM